jgi:hypothetical protein
LQAVGSCIKVFHWRVPKLPHIPLATLRNRHKALQAENGQASAGDLRKLSGFQPAGTLAIYT